MKKLSATLLLSMGCLLGTASAHAQSWAGASDVLALALPALAGAYTLHLEDRPGSEQMAWTLGGTLVSTLALKSLIQSDRPDHSDNDSFPSGHTAIAFASARFLQKRYGNDMNPWALYGAAALTGLARVRADQHHWRDTVAGAALGYAFADYVTEQRPGQHLSLLPTPTGMMLSWQRVW